MKDYLYAAFSGFGIEIEHMIVDRDKLSVLPVADQLLDLVGGAEDMDVDRGDAAWSNELALHVIEIKTAGPISNLESARAIFRREVDTINDMLVPLGGRLMPTGMHPWMDPAIETRLWPHQNNEIYSSFDRIFSCQGHGWSNLQSMHINFPFRTEDEFAKLHAACRLVLPILPALAASSPFVEGKRAPVLDQRLLEYRKNCERIPSITGSVIPEPVFSEAAYQELLESIYRDIAPFDKEGILQEEWLNARGAIARFDRGAVEIRVIDTQECPEQDISIAYVVTELMQALFSETYVSLSEMQSWSTGELERIYNACVQKGENADLPTAYTEVFGRKAQTAGQLWSSLVSELVAEQSVHRSGLCVILEQGTLSSRLLRAHDKRPLREIYEDLCNCLSAGLPYAS